MNNLQHHIGYVKKCLYYNIRQSKKGTVSKKSKATYNHQIDNLTLLLSDLEREWEMETLQTRLKQAHSSSPTIIPRLDWDFNYIEEESKSVLKEAVVPSGDKTDTVDTPKRKNIQIPNLRPREKYCFEYVFNAEGQIASMDDVISNGLKEKFFKDKGQIQNAVNRLKTKGILKNIPGQSSIFTLSS